MFFIEKKTVNNSKREPYFDFLRSMLMIFVFLHHFYLSAPGVRDYAYFVNASAELFVALSGFMVGFIYLFRDNHLNLIKRGIKILFAYYSVAIPLNILYGLFGSIKSPIGITIFKTLIMMQDNTWVNILRFYGLIFILAPLIIKFFKFNRYILLCLSTLLFFTITIINSQFTFNNFFIVNTVFILLQWQLFFIIGMFLGDLYKQKRLNNKILYIYPIIFAILALLIQTFIVGEVELNKFPYGFGKMLNIIYVAPLWLYSIYFIYKLSKETFFDRFIRVIGRNSLFAFILSDYFRVAFKQIFLRSHVPQIYIEIWSLVVSIIFSVILIIILWIVEKIKNKSIEKVANIRRGCLKIIKI